MISEVNRCIPSRKRRAFLKHTVLCLILAAIWSCVPLSNKTGSFFSRFSDTDGDEINDSVDNCPYVPEDIDGWKDWDGCPEPDNDQDTIIDSMDLCPFEPEDKDGVEDTDGCPDGMKNDYKELNYE